MIHLEMLSAKLNISALDLSLAQLIKFTKPNKELLIKLILTLELMITKNDFNFINFKLNLLLVN